jgi:endoglucanase
LQDVAKEQEITLPLDPLPGGSGTDAWAIQIARKGIPTALLSIPLKSMHSPVETVSLKDIQRTGRLMAELIATLDENFMDDIAWKRTKNGKDENDNDRNSEDTD